MEDFPVECTAHGKAWCFRQDCVQERRAAVAARAEAARSFPTATLRPGTLIEVPAVDQPVQEEG